MKGNVIVGQSGGPTAVINSSLAGVFRAAKDLGAGKVYGMIHGIQGLLEGKYIDLSEYIKDGLDEELLKRTPSAYLGSCRFKLPEIEVDKDLFDRIFAILEELEIEVFIYIGGNDSMDTIKKLSDYAKINGSQIRFVGCPKTIDNDLALTDHTPGFGSAAKYIAASMKEIIRDAYCQQYPHGMAVIVEIMGRDAGWLTGSAALCKADDCVGPDMVYLPEVNFDIDDFLARCRAIIEEKDVVVVALSEGIRQADGRYVCELGELTAYEDAFGHKQLTGTADFLAGFLARELGCKTRAIELSTLQRAASHIASLVDIDEAAQAGNAAVRAAAAGETGVMPIFVRTSSAPYAITMEIRDIHQIANEVRSVPREWITEDGCNVTQDLVDYVRPLIIGELLPVYVDGMPRHLITPDLV